MPLGVWRLKVFLTSYLLPIVGGGLGLLGTWLGNSKELLGSQFVAGVWPSHYSVVWLFCSIPTVSSRPAPPTSITHLTGGHLYHTSYHVAIALCIKLILQCNVLSIIFAKKTNYWRTFWKTSSMLQWICSLCMQYETRLWPSVRLISTQYLAGGWWWTCEKYSPSLYRALLRCVAAFKARQIKIWQGWHKMAAHGSGWHIMGCGHSGCSRLTFIRSHLTLLLCKTSTIGWQSLQSSSILPNTL